MSVNITINGVEFTVSDGANVSVNTGSSLPTLEQILVATPFAPTESANIRSLGLKNIDDGAGEENYTNFSANTGAISIKCNRTGRELIIDFNSSTPQFLLS